MADRTTRQLAPIQGRLLLGSDESRRSFVASPKSGRTAEIGPCPLASSSTQDRLVKGSPSLVVGCAQGLRRSEATWRAALPRGRLLQLLPRVHLAVSDSFTWGRVGHLLTHRWGSSPMGSQATQAPPGDGGARKAVSPPTGRIPGPKSRSFASRTDGVEHAERLPAGVHALRLAARKPSTVPSRRSREVSNETDLSRWGIAWPAQAQQAAPSPTDFANDRSRFGSCCDRRSPVLFTYFHVNLLVNRP
jgi:hypothetical protein